MKKKILALLLSAVMIAALVPVLTFAADGASGECGENGSNVTWSLNSVGTLTISGTGRMKEAEYEGVSPWSSVGNDVKNVVVEKGVTYIEREAFVICENLKNINVNSQNSNYSSVDGVLFNKDKTELICYPHAKTDTSYTIPNVVTSIGKRAFYFCGNLTSIKIPAGVTSIGDEAFRACQHLKSIEIPEGVTSLEFEAFAYCIALERVKLPSTLKTIESHAFYNCRSLKSIEIPAGVTSINGGAFVKCDSLESISIPDGVTSIGVFQFSGLKSIIIPASVTRIDEGTFLCCFKLESVEIPDSVTEIGESAFSACESLKNVYYDGTQDQWNNISIGDDNEPLKNAELHCQIATVTLTDPETGIAAVVPEDSIGEGTVLAVEEVSPADAGIAGLSETAAVYEIHFEKDGDPVQYNGEAGISIPVPEALNGSMCKVYYIDEKGNKTDVFAECEDGNQVFTAKDFGYFAVEEISYLPGDVNADSTVNAKDKAILNRYLAGWAGYEAQILNRDAADLDSDGDVVAKDKAIINRYLAGWKGYGKYFLGKK